MGRTLYEKVYDAHVVNELSGELPLLYIDRHLLHEVTSPQAFSGLREAGRKLRRPDLMLATMDHDISTQKATLDVCRALRSGAATATRPRTAPSGHSRSASARPRSST